MNAVTDAELASAAEGGASAPEGRDGGVSTKVLAFARSRRARGVAVSSAEVRTLRQLEADVATAV